MTLSKELLRNIVLWLVIAAGLIIVSPYFNFQDYLSQGDHGRDLYAAQAVYRGELPYRDFWWVYGPLTPYYYGLFFKIFGTKISSMILGKLIVRILGGVLLCLGLMEITTEMAAFAGACWFMLFAQDFFFTYNHIAGVAMDLGVIWGLLGYINRNDIKCAWASLGFIFILCLIKINFGLAALVMALITVAVCDWVRRNPMDGPKKIFYTIALVLLPLIVFLIYYSLLHGLSAMEIRQCLPYKEGDQPYEVSPWVAIGTFVTVLLQKFHSPWDLIFALIINASILRCLYLVFTNKIGNRTNFLLSLGMLLVLYVFNSHEFLKSGVWYRDFWAQPVSNMMIFLVIDTACRSLPEFVRKIVFTWTGLMAIFCWFMIMRSVDSLKTDSHFLDLPRGGIYISNAPSWISTVEQTTNYLNQTLKPNELFFALPYDCLYYYLTDKRTPTRQLIFFEHIKIPPEQEKSVIAELEANHVNYVLVSSRAFVRQELGLGFLGKTYCPLIGQYIHDHYTPIARFGDWTDEPGWAWNHGTLILKRNVPFN